MSTKITPAFPSGDDLIEDGRFTTVEKVQAATDDEILSVKNVGPAALEKIRAAAPALVETVTSQPVRAAGEVASAIAGAPVVAVGDRPFPEGERPFGGVPMTAAEHRNTPTRLTAAERAASDTDSSLDDPLAPIYRVQLILTDRTGKKTHVVRGDVADLKFDDNGIADGAAYADIERLVERFGADAVTVLVPGQRIVELKGK